MSTSAVRLNQMILDQLAMGERRVLSLVVAVRKALDASDGVRGDLSARVQSELRRLVASHEVVDVDGVFSLSPRR